MRDILIGAIIALVLLAGSFFAGVKYQDSKWETKMQIANAEIDRLKVESGKVTIQVVTEYVDRIKYIEKIQKVNIPIYITKEDDAKCVINQGAVDLLNSGATNTPPPEVTESTKADSEKKLSEVTAVVRENYITYNKVKAQLESLQKWIIEQEKKWNEK
jgi:hypothetical protein